MQQVCLRSPLQHNPCVARRPLAPARPSRAPVTRRTVSRRACERGGAASPARDSAGPREGHGGVASGAEELSALWACVASTGFALAVLAMFPEAVKAGADDGGIMQAAGVATQHFADLAENEDFWGNVVRYMRYFVSVMLGTGYIFVKPLANMMKKPTTAIFVIGFAVFTIVFVNFTVQSMLGLNDVQFSEAGSLLPNRV
ncbi:unnamed protein product [Pedinophyceae sp. YPF-701]|nr:unnamed protein product [Pedinophyceae sp. YPF-701]